MKILNKTKKRLWAIIIGMCLGIIFFSLLLYYNINKASASVKTTVIVSVKPNLCNTCIANINPYHYKRNILQTRFCEWVCDRYK